MSIRKLPAHYVLLFALCTLLFVQSCQTSSAGGNRPVYKSSGKSSDTIIKVSLYTPLRNSQGERYVYYTILVSKSWCEKRGRRLDEPLMKVVPPFVAFGVDDAVMNQFLNFILDSGFMSWPERQVLDIETLKRVDKAAPVILIETPSTKKTVLATDIKDAPTAKSFDTIRKMFIDIANRYPSTRVWAGGVQEPPKK